MIKEGIDYQDTIYALEVCTTWDNKFYLLELGSPIPQKVYTKEHSLMPESRIDEVEPWDSIEECVIEILDHNIFLTNSEWF